MELRWGSRTYVMGIVNVTPDSFSGDGIAEPGRPSRDIVAVAVARATAFADAGAEIIDIGAESTRPRTAYGEHPEVTVEDELSRAVPVVRAVAEAVAGRAIVSIDTSKGAVARAALAAGAGMVNDVWGAQRDPGTAEAAAAAGAYLVVMHNQDGSGYPRGVRVAVTDWLRASVAIASSHGVARDRLIIDPGIGFGKGTADNLELLRHLRTLKEDLANLPVLLGTSRKRFLGELLGGSEPGDRLEGTAATVALGIAAGVDIVRVHDVAPMARIRDVADAIIRGR